MTVRYVSSDEDSDRWSNFTFRDGDIVISTRSKSGTTWLQMICALLIFQTSKLPDRLGAISPWIDTTTAPIVDVITALESQQHRRFVKSHTPLDGIPYDERATYIVAGRHPLDLAVSLYHQGNNIDRRRIRELTGQPEPQTPPPPRASLHEWLVDWTQSTATPHEAMDSLPGVMWHIADAWERAQQQANVMLVHYDDLLADLDAAMRSIADRLGIGVGQDVWPSLVQAATFASMKAGVDDFAPNTSGVLKDNAAFFRRGQSGAGQETLSPSEFSHYLDRANELSIVAFRQLQSAGRLGDGVREDDEATAMLRWLHH